MLVKEKNTKQRGGQTGHAIPDFCSHLFQGRVSGTFVYFIYFVLFFLVLRVPWRGLLCWSLRSSLASSVVSQIAGVVLGWASRMDRIGSGKVGWVFLMRMAEHPLVLA